MTLGETPVTLTVHGLTLGGIVLILGLLFKQHKIWTRMKDRLNQLWFHHCVKSGDKYEPIENGK